MALSEAPNVALLRSLRVKVAYSDVQFVGEFHIDVDSRNHEHDQAVSDPFKRNLPQFPYK